MTADLGYANQQDCILHCAESLTKPHEVYVHAHHMLVCVVAPLQLSLAVNLRGGRDAFGLPTQACHGMVEMPHCIDFSFLPVNLRLTLYEQVVPPTHHALGRIPFRV